MFGFSGNNREVYDFASITLHTDRVRRLSVKSVRYTVEYTGEPVPYGIGDPSLCTDNRGIARGMFKGTFEFEMNEHDWEELSAAYSTEYGGIFNGNGIVFVMSKANSNGFTRLQHIFHVYMKGYDVNNMDEEGGKPVIVSVKGILKKQPERYLDGKLTNGMPFV